MKCAPGPNLAAIPPPGGYHVQLANRCEEPLRYFSAIAALMLAASRAEADPQWREYAYPDQQFAVSFPAPPSVTKIDPDAGAPSRMTKTAYYLQQQERGNFVVAVFDMLRAGISEPAAIARAAATLRQKGKVSLDIAAEVQGHWGRYLSFENRDGSHTVAAVYFRNDRLYEIEATAPASTFAAVSSDMVRFQQSLRFIGSLRSRRYVPEPPGSLLQNLGGRLFAPGR